jgi:RNA polymerase sigma-70 factor, ECF subfamily
MSPSVAGRETSERTFERLYRRHRGDLYRSVLRDLRNPDDAEDVTQVAFLNAYRALKRGSEPDNPRAWLLTIARNVTRRRFRGGASRVREVELDPEALVAPEPDAPSATEIREALRRLRPNQRAVIVFREIGGLSYAEIAETLELSVPAVETLLFRARRALREELATAEDTGVVRVGGIALWPLPVALSEAWGPLGGWLARHGLAVKVAGGVGAAVIGTGVAVQAGAVPVADRGPELAMPAMVTPAGAGDAARERAAEPAKAAARKATRPKGQAGTVAGHPVEQPAPAAGGGTLEAPVELPMLSPPQLQLPQVQLGALSVQLSAVEVPDVPLPAPELPPVPDVGDLLP